MNITIKNVPEGAENAVKEMAMVAIERFKAKTELAIPEATKKTYEDSIDVIRVANSMSKKYEEVVEEEIKEVVAKI